MFLYYSQDVLVINRYNARWNPFPIIMRRINTLLDCGIPIMNTPMNKYHQKLEARILCTEEVKAEILSCITSKIDHTIDPDVIRKSSTINTTAEPTSDKELAIKTQIDTEITISHRQKAESKQEKAPTMIKSPKTTLLITEKIKDQIDIMTAVGGSKEKLVEVSIYLENTIWMKKDIVELLLEATI